MRDRGRSNCRNSTLEINPVFPFSFASYLYSCLTAKYSKQLIEKRSKSGFEIIPNVLLALVLLLGKEGLDSLWLLLRNNTLSGVVFFSLSTLAYLRISRQTFVLLRLGL